MGGVVGLSVLNDYCMFIFIVNVLCLKSKCYYLSPPGMSVLRLVNMFVDSCC